MTARIELLRTVPLFADLEDEGLAAVAEVIEEAHAPRGARITTEGRQEGWFFVIVEGTATVERDGRAINRLEPGDFFGEVALIDGGPRTASVIAETDMRLLALKQHRFDDLLAVSPKVHATVTAAFEEYLRRIDAGGDA